MWVTFEVSKQDVNQVNNLQKDCPTCASCQFILCLRVCFFYRTQVNLGSDLWVRLSVRETPLWNLTDVTLADEDTNSILTDNANGAIQGNVAMQWRNLVANFGSNASGASWWPNFEPMQVVPLGDPICNWCEWCLLVAKFAISANSSIWWPNCANNGWGIT